MAYAIVGSPGAVAQGGSGASVTPAWGTGENRTANNLLILWVTGKASATLPAAPSGWSTAVQKAGTSCSASVFYKIAAGADTAPTVAGVTGTNLSCRLAEFSGNKTSSPLDQTGTAAGTTSTQVATSGSADTAADELIIYACSEVYSASTSVTSSVALNNGATATDTNNNGSGVNHYNFGYGITTGNGSADTATLTFTTTNITGTAVALASFQLPASGPPPAPPLPTAHSYPAGSGLKPFTYCFYEVLTGQYLGQLPLSQVTFGSQLLQPGTFSGTIDAASQAVQNLGVFDLIQPGRTALLIDYLGSFIWGGIIWTAPYDQDGTKRQVQVNATEIWSYFQNNRVQATDYSAPPYSGITGNLTKMPIWDATNTDATGVYDPVLIAWQMLSDAIYYVPNGNLFGGTGIAANGYTTAASYLASGTNASSVDYLSESYPYSSMQQLGSALNQLATLGLGVGFDYGVDVGGTATGPVTCTVNLSYPRRGRTFANNNLVLDTQRALKFSVPPDATQTGNTMYEQGANGALSVSQNAQPLNGGYPILERLMSRSNIQSANVMEVLQQTGAADLAIYSFPVNTPTVTTDLFTGPVQLGQFIVGDDVWWRVPKTDGIGNTFCPRFPNGLDVEGRIIAYQATVADAGTSTLTLTLSEPPSYTVQGPWLP